MHKLIIRQGDVEQVHEFETSELAQLYRDYHLAFGNWNGTSRWIEARKVTPEEAPFIVDEKTELVNEEVVRFYRITDGIQLKIEEASPDCLEDLWKLFREKRNKWLQLTDWTQLADCELDTEQRKEYRAYRSYLRTLPKLYNDSSVVYAKVYSFEDWKKGKR
jgi:hypothetical protein